MYADLAQGSAGLELDDDHLLSIQTIDILDDLCAINHSIPQRCNGIFLCEQVTLCMYVSVHIYA